MTEDVPKEIPQEINAKLLACCGSRRWAEAMAALWPFASPEQLAEQAAHVWRGLAREDWLEAFASHPRIGDLSASGTAASEQAGARAATPEELEELARLNREYEARFGYIYIVCASGKPAAKMLDILRRRLLNNPRRELGVAAEEQLAITQIRLQKTGGLL
jgi:OHCU decarboxylase